MILFQEIPDWNRSIENTFMARVTIIDPKTRKVLKKYKFSLPKKENEFIVSYKKVEGEDLLVCGVYGAYNTLCSKQKASGYLNLLTGEQTNDNPFNLILSFRKFTPYKFVLDRLHESHEFKSLGKKAKAERLFSNKELLQSHVSIIQPFTWQGKTLYLTLLENKMGLYVYDSYLKLLGNGVNVKKGSDFWKNDLNLTDRF